jgi:hypothetical protein
MEQNCPRPASPDRGTGNFPVKLFQFTARPKKNPSPEKAQGLVNTLGKLAKVFCLLFRRRPGRRIPAAKPRRMKVSVQACLSARNTLFPEW